MMLPVTAPRVVFGRILLICVGSRLVLQAIGFLSLSAHGQPVWSNALEMWSRWDAPHYLRVAEVGYTKGTPPPDDPLFIVFFPFFPLAVKIVSFVFRDLIASGLVVSLAASVGAGWFLYRVVAFDNDEDTAWRAVVLLFSFPTAYFLSAPYSESLFLSAVLASIYAARTGRWARSGLAGALATGTRVTGVALAPALIAEAFTGSARVGERVRRLACVGLAGAGLATYLVINHVVHGDALWFLEVQRFHWDQRAIPPWRSIIDALRGLADGAPSSTHTFIFAGRIAAFVFAVPLLSLAVRRVRPADSLYAWSGFLLILSASWLISLPRYLLVLYPIFVVGAKLLGSSSRAFNAAVAAGCVLQGWLFWRYAVGEWTF